MKNRSSLLRSVTYLALLGFASLLLVPVDSSPVWGDDRDLLRFNTSKPYLFLLLDTSASMSLKMGPVDEWVPGGADNPESRLFQAKQALHEVFKNVQDLHFGFAGFNQDFVRARQKHWLYFTTEVPAGSSMPWPLSFPAPETDGSLTEYIDTPIEDTNGDGILDTGDGVLEPVGDIDTGDVLTFGPHFPIGTIGVAGACDAPLDLDTKRGRQRAQAFAIQGDSEPGTPTVLWLSEKGLRYRLAIARTATSLIGNKTLDLQLNLTPYTACPIGDEASLQFTLTVQQDAFLNQTLYVDAIDPDKDAETTAQLWNWSDIESIANYSIDDPFTGKGWEGNYDSGFTSGVPAFDTKVTMADPYCTKTSSPGCSNPPKPIQQTAKGLNPETGVHAPALDVGDVIPFDWQNEQKEKFLQRLAPNLIASPGVCPISRSHRTSPTVRSLQTRTL